MTETSTSSIVSDVSSHHTSGHQSGVWSLLEHANLIDTHRTETLLKCPGYRPHLGRYLVTSDGFIVDWLNLTALHMDDSFWEYLEEWVNALYHDHSSSSK